MLGKVIPRPHVDLHPRLLRQGINPFKALGHALATEKFYQELDALRQKNFPADPRAYVSSSLQRPPRCKGFFWDSKNMRLVEVDLGHVYLRPVFSYRAAPSLAVSFFGESAEILSREEGAAQYENFSTFEHRAERSEHGAEEGEKSPGPYVIPGQSPTDGNNAQILSNKSTFEWSVEKCEAELC